MALGFYGAVIAALVGVDVAELMSIIGSSAVGPAVKFTVAFPFIYHFLGGVRHFVWDTFPDTVDNKIGESSSWAMFGLTAAGCLGASMVSI